MTKAVCKEIELRKIEINDKVETIYFGGGTPSLLDQKELEQIFETLYKNFDIAENPEITLEANPDDLTKQKIKILKSTPINRLSIGVQSFFDADLKFMNRAHNQKQAGLSIMDAQDAGFENITIDLIYGGQTTTDEMWKKNLETALELQVPHISSYALTVEPKTILDHQIKTKKVAEIDDEKQERQFLMLVDSLTENGFLHYEISNFGKAGFLSKHNSSYWKGVPYLGIGPSAHSFDGENRSWNIANNTIYLNHINKGKLPLEIEHLSVEDRFNEMLMIRLRTMDGLAFSEIKENFPEHFFIDFLNEILPHIENGTMRVENERAYITKNGLFLSDGIASSLFRLGL